MGGYHYKSGKRGAAVRAKGNQREMEKHKLSPEVLNNIEKKVTEIENRAERSRDVTIERYKQGEYNKRKEPELQLTFELLKARGMLQLAGVLKTLTERALEQGDGETVGLVNECAEHVNNISGFLGVHELWDFLNLGVERNDIIRAIGNWYEPLSECCKNYNVDFKGPEELKRECEGEVSKLARD